MRSTRPRFWLYPPGCPSATTHCPILSASEFPILAVGQCFSFVLFALLYLTSCPSRIFSMPQSMESSVFPSVFAMTTKPLFSVTCALWFGEPETWPAVRMMPSFETMTPVPEARLTLMLTTAGLTFFSTSWVSVWIARRCVRDAGFRFGVVTVVSEVWCVGKILFGEQAESAAKRQRQSRKRDKHCVLNDIFMISLLGLILV